LGRSETARVLLLGAVGAAIGGVAIIGLVLPASIFEYTVPVKEPLPILYSTTVGRTVLAGTFLSLSLLFGLAVYIATKLASPQARNMAILGTLVISLIFGLGYASGAQDMYHNIFDFRTVWVYKDNPMLTPPLVHADDPLFRYVLAWEASVSAYGPLFYLLGVPFSVVAGEDLLANVIGVKLMQGIGLLALVWLVASEAERLSPGKGVAAIVAVGWNPFIQWETLTNSHNDALMMIFAIAALAMATRLLFSQSLIALCLAGAIKYSGLILGPLIFLWSWRRVTEQQRLSVAALIFCGIMVTIAIYLVLPDTVHEIRDFLTTDRIWKSPIAVITNTLEPSLGAQTANDVARFGCWGLVLASFVVAVLRLNTSVRSLYQASFIALAALGTLSRPEFFTWYFIWFIPIGAVLIGSWEWRLSYLASCAGLITYAFFPWSPDTPTTNVLYVLFTLGLPLLALGLFQLFERLQSRPAAEATPEAAPVLIENRNP
jgi:hypothetical protein